MVTHFPRPVLVVPYEDGAGVALKCVPVVMQIVLSQDMHRITLLFGPDQKRSFERRPPRQRVVLGVAV